jgi:hypothetical protein
MYSGSVLEKMYSTSVCVRVGGTTLGHQDERRRVLRLGPYEGLDICTECSLCTQVFESYTCIVCKGDHGELHKIDLRRSRT